MERIHIILLIVIAIGVIAFSVWLYFKLTSPEYICNRICGYDPFAPFPTGGTCEKVEEEEMCRGIFIPPDCCCHCIV